jgi:ribosome biogenesis GTPase
MRGVVIKSTGKWYKVLLDSNEIVNATIKGKLRLKDSKTTNPIAAGDYVEVNSVVSGDENLCSIESILERKNYLVRRSTNLSKQMQIIAANVDRVYLITTIKSPVTQLGFIDRFLVAAESFRINTSILFNKTDLYNSSEMKHVDELMNKYNKIGYPCHKISALDNKSVLFLKAEIKDKKVMISGNSGVGKTTLVNSLDPNLNLRVGEISSSHEQGKHTTTFAEMHPLQSGGFIIDTPGIKAFGLVDLEKEHYAHYFPEMRDQLGKCKFHNCLHLEEPDCQVKESVQNGNIAESRYKTYLQLMNEDASDPYRRNEYK